MRSYLLCSAVLLAACGVSDANVTDDDLASYEQKLSANSCRYKCEKCPPNRVCILSCTQIGNCPDACTVIALCVDGYRWDDTACACLPDTSGGGEACGSNTCAAGQVCCNASCGICTAPGDACIQLACTTG